jgi:molecular chaperone GrpE
MPAGEETQEPGDILTATGEDSGAPENEGAEALDAAKTREAELLTRLKYMQADFDNYRKRVEKDAKEKEESSSKGLVIKLLSVLDELDLAAKHTKEEAGRAELQEGIEMVQRHLYGALEEAGLRRIEALGQPFDPSVHEAVAKVQGAAPGQDMVVEELRAGYTLRGRVLRPSMVKVELAMKEQVEEGKAVE